MRILGHRLVLSVGLLAFGLSSAASESSPVFALHDGDRVVFYGDSITQKGGYAQFVEQFARSRFPDWDLHFYNEGVGGDTVMGGAAGDITLRLDRDVIPLRPTVVTIMLGMNDGRYRPLDAATRQAFRTGYAAIIKRLRQALPQARLYLIRSSPFDDYARPPEFEGGYDQVLHELGDEVAALGREYGLPVVDLSAPVIAGIRKVASVNPELATQLLPDRVHPAPAAQLLMGATLLRAWDAPAKVTRVEIDAKTGAVVAAGNTRIQQFHEADGGLAWDQLDRALPLPLNFGDADVELAQMAGADLNLLDQEMLVVKGLAAKRYEVGIDDRVLGAFTAAKLAAGINLARDDTPMRKQAYQARWASIGAHERQRVARGAQYSGQPALIAAAKTLLASDELDQERLSQRLVPKSHRFSIRPLP